MTSEITTNKALTAAAFLLVAIMGWMFNKIMFEMDILGDEMDNLQVRMAVMEEKMSKQERD